MYIATVKKLNPGQSGFLLDMVFWINPPISNLNLAANQHIKCLLAYMYLCLIVVSLPK